MIKHVPTTKRSVLVTLDMSDAGQLALDIAARMAALSQAELEGVFVEDIDLISLSKLPFLRQVSACSLVAEAISPEQIQRDLNAEARQAERMLIQQAKLMGVDYSFRIWRGHASLETLSVSFEADILSIAKSPAYRRRVVSTRSSAIENICVLLSDVSHVNNVLLAARLLANNLNVPVKVLLPSGRESQINYEKNLIEIHGLKNNKTEYIYFVDVSALIDALKAAGNIVLFVEFDHLLFRHAEFNQYLATVAPPILIVRPES